MTKSNGKATAAVVLGVISLLGLLSPIVGIVCGIIAIVLSSLAKTDGMVIGRAKTGRVLGIIGTVIGVAMWIINIIMLYVEV